MKALLMIGAAMTVAVAIFYILSVPVEPGLVSNYHYAPAPVTVHTP